MAEETIVLSELDPNFRKEIASIPGGENINRCYACGTCTVSCPVFEQDEDYNPRKIIRMVILGMRKEVLSSELIWLCANCHTCFERCPQDVKFTSIIHALRIIATNEAKKGKLKIKFPSYYFMKSFLGSVKLHGRVWEPEVVFRLSLFQNVKKTFGFLPVGINMFRKGKLPILPSRVKNKKVIRKIFRRSGEGIST